MSRKTEESNLKPPAVRECESAEGVEAARDRQSGRTNPKKVEKKAALRVQGKGKVGDTMTKPKRIAKVTPGIKLVDDSLLLTTNSVKGENASVKNIITADPAILSAEAEFQEQELVPSVGAAVGSKTHPGLVAAGDLVLDHKPRILFAEDSIEQKEEPEVDTLAKQTEVPADLEMRPTTEPQRRSILKRLAGALVWARKHMGYSPARKRLRVCETVSLGEKRFVAVIEVDGEQFLVGGAASSVATLARLEPSPQFAEVLRRRWAQDPIQA